MRAGVIVFPGSNCDADTVHALAAVTRATVDRLWHADPPRARYDLLVLPGGFSYGDYLRTGAIAARSPIMDVVRRHAADGGLVLGICNGFQILVEAGLLPGALLVNRSVRFVCRDVHLRVENARTPFTRAYGAGAVIRLPVAHGMGNFRADEATLDRLDREGRVVLRYCDASGAIDEAANPNGSARAIAGLVNDAGNVLGLMPHPERNAEECLGNGDGAGLFRSIAEWTAAAAPGAGSRRPRRPRAFPDRVAAAVTRCGTPLCVGLDPVLERLPRSIVAAAEERHGRTRRAAAWAAGEFSRRVLAALAGRVPAVKIQSACFEAYGAEGARALSSVVRAARALGYLVIADVKRGDIGSTSLVASRGLFGGAPLPGGKTDGGLAVDAVTVNPYLGREGVEPFISAAVARGGGVFVLVATSNPGAETFQQVRTGGAGGDEEVCDLVALAVEEWGAAHRGECGYSAVGAVVGATRAGLARRLRARMPHALLLIPGVGAQGARAEDLAGLFDPDGGGALVTVSRSLIYAHEARPGCTLEEAVVAEADRLAREIDRARSGERSEPQ
jgi:phosphoribosylformylglycinamidine synthase